MKACSKCAINKDESNYFVKNCVTGRLHAQCKDCYKVSRKKTYSEHYQLQRQKYLDRAKARNNQRRFEFRVLRAAYMSDKQCVDCGERDHIVLELDHIDPSTKLFPIAQAVGLHKSWDDVLAEMTKCDVVCANCHKRRTAIQFGWHKANL